MIAVEDIDDVFARLRHGAELWRELVRHEKSVGSVLSVALAGRQLRRAVVRMVCSGLTSDALTLGCLHFFVAQLCLDRFSAPLSRARQLGANNHSGRPTFNTIEHGC